MVASGVPHAGAESRPARLLVVEDDALIREFLLSTLRERGYTVDEANNGVEALVRLSEHRPDVVILDLMLPVVDGWTFVERVRRQPGGAEIPIIVVSAVESLFDATATLPVRAVLSKPFDIDVLLAHIERARARADATA